MNTQDPKTWFNIFRVGRHTARNGETHDYPEQDLRKMIARYDTEADAAPIVVGHPETHTPAYGWIAELRLKDGIVQARARDVQQSFVDAVKAGAYRKISIAIRRMEDGVLRLLHVGFLGGAAPAITGLGEVQWSESDVRTRYEYTYLSENASSEVQLAQQMQQAQKILEDAEYRSFTAELQSRGIINPLGNVLTRKIMVALRDSEQRLSAGKSLYEEFQECLLSLNQSIDFEEYTSEKSHEIESHSARVIQSQARAYQDSHPTISWPEAVTHVTSQRKGS